MTRTMHACDYCGSEYTSPLAAALCCDVVSNDLDDGHVTIPGSVVPGLP